MVALILCMPEALCKLVIIIYNPAARYKAWIHRCVCMQSSPYFAQGMYVYNPWGSIVCAEQSMDCVNPCFAHGTIHGLHAQSTDYCTSCGSIDCAGQSTDCPDPYFAHNIHFIICYKPSLPTASSTMDNNKKGYDFLTWHKGNN